MSSLDPAATPDLGTVLPGRRSVKLTGGGDWLAADDCEIRSHPKGVMRTALARQHSEGLLVRRSTVAADAGAVGAVASIGKAKMMSDDGSQEGIQVDRTLLIGGGVLVGIGGLLAFSGMVLVGSALLSATRQWVDQLERPPSEVARRTWRQARAAVSAGAEAWRNGPQIPSSPS